VTWHCSGRHAQAAVRGRRALCITDEHYDPTVLAYQGVGGATTCNPNSLVEVNWRQYAWEPVRTPRLVCTRLQATFSPDPTTTCTLHPAPAAEVARPSRHPAHHWTHITEPRLHDMRKSQECTIWHQGWPHPHLSDALNASMSAAARQQGAGRAPAPVHAARGEHADAGRAAHHRLQLPAVPDSAVRSHHARIRPRFLTGGTQQPGPVLCT